MKRKAPEDNNLLPTKHVNSGSCPSCEELIVIGMIESGYLSELYSQFCPSFHRTLYQLTLVMYKKNYIEAAKLLSQKKLNKNSVGQRSEDLCEAASNGRIDIVKFILTLSKDHIINKISTIFKKTALFIAAEKGYTDIVKLFLEYDEINVNTKGRAPKKITALIAAIENENVDIVELLLNHPKIQLSNALATFFSSKFLSSKILKEENFLNFKQLLKHGAPPILRPQLLKNLLKATNKNKKLEVIAKLLFKYDVDEYLIKQENNIPQHREALKYLYKQSIAENYELFNSLLRDQKFSQNQVISLIKTGKSAINYFTKLPEVLSSLIFAFVGHTEITRWEDPENIVKNYTPNTTKINIILANDGLAIQDVPSDGNCFFHAIAARSGINEAYLRENAVAHMRQHPENFIDFLENDFEAEMDRISTPGEWADEPVIQAVANAFNFRITIYRLDGTIIIRENQNNSEEEMQQVSVVYTGNHYLAVLPNAAPSLMNEMNIFDSFELWPNLETAEQAAISSNLQNSIDLENPFQEDVLEISSISSYSEDMEDSLEESLMPDQENKAAPETNVAEPVILNPETITITNDNQLAINDNSLWHRLHLDFNSDSLAW